MLSRTLGSSRRFNAVAALANGDGEFAQLLFTLLIPHADDFGRMVGDAFTVKLQVFPASARTVEDFAAALDALDAAELITVYAVERDIWLQVNKFDEHQRGLANRTASRIPSPPTTPTHRKPNKSDPSSPQVKRPPRKKTR